MKTEKQKEWEKLLIENVKKAETIEEWEEKVKFMAGFSYKS